MTTYSLTISINSLYVSQDLEIQITELNKIFFILKSLCKYCLYIKSLITLFLMILWNNNKQYTNNKRAKLVPKLQLCFLV